MVKRGGGDKGGWLGVVWRRRKLVPGKATCVIVYRQDRIAFFPGLGTMKN